MLVYAHKETARLKYICAFIFQQHFGIGYTVTTDQVYFADFSGPKINYSTASTRNCYTLRSGTSILFETDIREQPVRCFESNGLKAFFPVEGADFSFDIFAAAFYLLSRYEEYLPYKKDLYGRYAHENSLAFKEGFLQQPLINIWLDRFEESLKQFYPQLQLRNNDFSYLPTYDIDIAWSYKNKGLLRDVGGFLLKPSFRRLQVLQSSEKDPYDCYEFLDQLHTSLKLQPIYFFLVAGMRSRYDKNSSIQNKEMQQLIREHAEKYTVGLHPSWKSNDDPTLLLSEKIYLEDLLPSDSKVNCSRQHYIRLHLPETYHNLLKAGIRNDYSMGYGTVNGFRASVASPFFWYDLKNEQETELLIHPFCFMDATCFFQNKQSADESFAELLYYYSVCKEVNGKMITIFHNNILGGGDAFKEWPAMYERFLTVVRSDSTPD